mgnify:CR=1 FL=1
MTGEAAGLETSWGNGGIIHASSVQPWAAPGMPRKILGWLGPTKEVGSQLWIGGVIELVCGVLIALGLFTRPAALLASGTMAVAYFQFHWKLSLEDYKFLPIVNHGELAVLFCFVFLLIAIRGAGIASIDHLRA